MRQRRLRRRSALPGAKRRSVQTFSVASGGNGALANLFRHQEVHEWRRRGGNDEGQQQRRLDVAENACDADEDVEEADPDGEEQTTADEDRLQNVEEHVADAADDVGGAEDAERASLQHLVG